MNNLTATQEQICITQNIYPESSLYNVGGYVEIVGELSLDLLGDVIKTVLKRADVIGISQYELNRKELDNIELSTDFDISVIDLSDKMDSDQFCLAWIYKDMAEQFKLNGHLLRTRLFKCSKTKHYWYTKVHHIIFDGYAMALFFNEVSSLYSEYIKKGRLINPLLFKYSDFIANENEYRLSDAFKSDRQFWIQQLSNLSEAKAFQSCLKATNVSSLTCKKMNIAIPRDLYIKIDRFCQGHHCTPFQYFVSILFILNKFYNNKNPIIGIPVLNRRCKEFRKTLGTFVNALPIYLSISDDDTFLDIFLKTKNEIIQSYKHQRYPLLNMLQDLDLPGNVFNVIFSYQRNHYNKHLGNSSISVNYIPSFEQQEDLNFQLLEYSESEDLTLILSYKEDLFAEDIIERLMNNFYGLLSSVFLSKDLSIKGMSYLTFDEENQLLDLFNNSRGYYPVDKTIAQLFEQQAENSPSEIALICGENVLTYKQLNDRGNRLARYLRINYFLEPNDIIGIKLERDESLIIAILSVIKLLCAYMPIDPHYSETRCDFMVKDSNTKVIIDSNIIEKFKNDEAKYAENNLASVGKSGDLFCVLYTSGSTGDPKGCLLENKGVLNNLYSKISLLKMKSGYVVCHNSELWFVGAGWQLWAPLLSGGKVILCKSEELKDIDKLLSIADAFQAKMLTLIPSQLNEYLANEGLIKFGNIETLILTGEKLNARLVNMCYEQNSNLKIINTYGQTESSDDITFYKIPRNSTRGDVLIGCPIENMQIYILSDNESLCPIGVIGEICSSGVGVARGYLNRPELNAEKFILNPFKKGHRMYKTGDLGRWLPDGTLEMVGRSDGQIKIRGFRIELDEIKYTLLQHEMIDEVVMDFRNESTGSNGIIAYILSKEKINVTSVRAFLSRKLPYYMVPSTYVQLDKIPLLSNGKIDMKGLSKFDNLAIELGTEYAAPLNEMQIDLVRIWKEVLNNQKVGIDDNFFDLGGHSLSAVAMVKKIQSIYNVNINIRDVFENQCIRRLSETIRAANCKRKSNGSSCEEMDFDEIIKL